MLRTLKGRKRFLLRLTHAPADLAPRCAWTESSAPGEDEVLIRRLMAAYQTAAPTYQALGDSMWRDFFEKKHGAIHAALMGDDFATASTMLRDPAQCDLFWGFDGISRSEIQAAPAAAEYIFGGSLILDRLLRVAEAVGARRLANPEAWSHMPSRTPATADEVLDSLEEAFGFEIEIPNIFRKEFGLVTKRGILSYRIPQALFQAWRIAKLTAGIERPRVLEIGGGLGRTAFYARKFGIEDYTIVDLPLTSLAQGYFLGRAVGDDRVSLHGEDADEGAIRLVPPAAFLAESCRHDLIANIDSLTEMSREMAEAYIAATLDRTGLFLSVNHESNPFTVRELMIARGEAARFSRAPYWARQGYVEEIWRAGSSLGW